MVFSPSGGSACRSAFFTAQRSRPDTGKARLAEARLRAQGLDGENGVII